MRRILSILFTCCTLLVQAQSQQGKPPAKQHPANSQQGKTPVKPAVKQQPATGKPAATAQTLQQRYAAKITKVLVQLPAKDKKELDAAMTGITALGEPGITELAAMLQPQPEGNDTSLQYALGSYAFYVMQPGMEAARTAAVKAYCHALGRVADKENKAFLIAQLQIMGNDDAVAVLQSYLADERLCDPAARALVKIATDKADQALLQALSKATGTCQLSLLAALGDDPLPDEEVLVAITPFATADDLALRKLALFALANSGDPDRERVLAAAAEKSGYTYDVTNATASYLLYIQRMAQNGRTGRAAILAAALHKKCTGAEQVYTHVAALRLLADIRGANILPVLLDAADDPDPVYRGGALQIAAVHMNAQNAALWVVKEQQLKGEKRAAIITLLGNSREKAALQVVTVALRDRDTVIKQAAIQAAGRLGSGVMISPLLMAMEKGDEQDIQAIKSALLCIKGAEVAGKVAEALPHMPPAAQKALSEVLSARRPD